MHDAHLAALAAAIKDRKTHTVSLGPETVVDNGAGMWVLGAGGEPVDLRRTTAWVANPGDQVLVLRVGSDAWAVGPVTDQAPPPATATVVSYAAGVATVILGEPFGDMPLPSVVEVASGDTVGIVWHRDATGEWVGFIVGKLLASPGAAPPPPSPPPGTGDRPGTDAKIEPLRVPAAETHTWRQGWRTDRFDLYQGNAGSYSLQPYPQSGYWFYGRGAFDDYKGETIGSIRMDVKVIGGAGAGGQVDVRFRLHTAPTRPNGLPTLVGAEHVIRLAPGDYTGKKALTLPPAFGQALADGSAAGVAIVATSTADYRGIHGVAAHAASGHLTITSH